MDYTGIRQRKVIAMGGTPPNGDFGVEPLTSRNAGGPDLGKTNGKYLKDDERAARPPIEGNQANPDHGAM